MDIVLPAFRTRVKLLTMKSAPLLLHGFKVWRAMFIVLKIFYFKNLVILVDSEDYNVISKWYINVF